MNTKTKKRKYAIEFTQPSLTKQSFGHEANINTIMSRYEKTGVIENLNTQEGQFGDFTNIQTYQESLNQIMLAQNMFDSLPAQVRKYFENDPVLFVEFAQNPENQDTLVEMGLAERRPIAPDDASASPGETKTPEPTPTPQAEEKKPETAS